MLSINQLAWVANVPVSTVSGRAVGVCRPAVRCEGGITSSMPLAGFSETDGFPLRGRVGAWLVRLVCLLGRATPLHIYKAISVIFAFPFFNLCVVHMWIFSISSVFSGDVQDYLACSDGRAQCLCTSSVSRESCVCALPGP